MSNNSDSKSEISPAALAAAEMLGVVPKSKTDMSAANPFLDRESNERPTKKPRFAANGSIGENPFQVNAEEMHGESEQTNTNPVDVSMVDTHADGRNDGSNGNSTSVSAVVSDKNSPGGGDYE